MQMPAWVKSNWHWLFTVFPLLTMWFAATLFNSVVEVKRMTPSFFQKFGEFEPSEGFLKIPEWISSEVLLSIYVWGVSFVAMIIVSFVVISVSIRNIWLCVDVERRKNILLSAILFALAISGSLLIFGYYPKNAVFDEIFHRTVGVLPMATGGIGNTASSIKDWLIPGSCILIAASIMASIASASTLTNIDDPKCNISDRSERLLTIILSAAAMLVLSYLTLGSVLSIGADVIKTADVVAADASNEEMAQIVEAAFARYQPLASSIETYWSVITSIALVSLYFPVASILWFRRPLEERSTAGIMPAFDLATRIITTASPLIVNGVSAIIAQLVAS